MRLESAPTKCRRARGNVVNPELVFRIRCRRAAAVRNVSSVPLSAGGRQAGSMEGVMACAFLVACGG